MGIWQFDTEPLLAAIEGALDFVRKGKPVSDAVKTQIGALTQPACMAIASDQEQKQLTGITALQRLRLNVEGLNDPSHRRHNDFKGALAYAGLMSIYYMSIIVYNVAYGPYNTAMWFHLLVQHGMDKAKAMLPDDLFLMKVWDQILKDDALQHTPGMNTKTMRQNYISTKFAYSKGSQLQGDKVAPAKWMSWHIAHEAWDNELHTRGLLIGSACMHMGRRLGP